ncbi:sigma-70 family RNA polymerase sigma factor [Catellatospora methionotrophica]|uniref:sigma-70 family RNA polymerase sigma factor n=1 Tax=Catellatospora methionotrophica TaxID=121620 RepID=UPI0033E1E75D
MTFLDDGPFIPHTGAVEISAVPESAGMQVGVMPLLTAAEEVELSKIIEAGVYAEWLLAQGADHPMACPAELERLAADGERAKERFIRSNLRLVASVARRYTNVDIDLVDLLQEGNIGLVRAVEKFDFRRGNKFSTYAVWWIRQTILRSMAAQNYTIQLPSHVMLQIQQMWQAERRLGAAGGTPADEDLAAMIGITPERLGDLRKWSEHTLSLHVVEETRPGHWQAAGGADPAEIVTAGLDRNMVRRILSVLDKRSRTLICLRYGLLDEIPRSAAEVGRQMGLSRQRVQQIEARALENLRQGVRMEHRAWLRRRRLRQAAQATMKSAPGNLARHRLRGNPD